MFEIYLIVNQENGKIYIGKTKRSLAQRWKEHVSVAQKRDNFVLSKAIRKYGTENFTIRRIDFTENEKEASELEKLYIGIFRSHKSYCGYNNTLGGEGGTLKKITREKISNSLRGNKNSLGCFRSKETKHKMRIAHLGKTLSESTKEKVRQAQLGRHPSEEVRIRMGLARKGKKRSDQEKQNIKAGITAWWKKRKISNTFKNKRSNP